MNGNLGGYSSSRHRTFISCCVTATLLLAGSCGGSGAGNPANQPAACLAVTGDPSCQTLTSGGAPRAFLLHVPANFQANSSGLVVVLHGSTGSGAQIASYSQMSQKADQSAFAVAYPYALVASPQAGSEWNNYFDAGIWASPAPDDVAFLRQLVGTLQAQIHPNPKKIYFAGFSNGGLMAYRVGIEMPDVVAAVGIVEGSLFGFGGNTQGVPAAAAPVSVVILHGDNDGTIPYCGSSGLATQETTFNYWSQTPANSCSTLDSAAPLCDAQGNITPLGEKEAAGCHSGAEVRFYKLIGGQHAWNSGPMNVAAQVPYNPAFDSTTGFTTNDILWNFFSAHPKP